MDKRIKKKRNHKKNRKQAGAGLAGKAVKVSAFLLGMSIILCALLAGGRLAGAAREAAPEEEESYDTGFIPEGIHTYDSADRAVVVKKSIEERTITLFNIPTGRNYTLQYDGTTHILNKYGGSMSMAQIQPGEIVEVTFLKSKKKLRTLSMSSDVWSNTVLGNYTINLNGRGIQVAKDQYELADNVMVVSEGRQAELMDISMTDKLLLKGIGRTVYSITVEEGHGYLRLLNDEYFIGGWIEVGQSLIKPVEEDMLLVVPEGSHRVLITNHGYGGTKSITVGRGEEVTLDVGDLKGEENKKGSVIFALTPPDASVYIDGDKADTSRAVEMDYGIHQLIVRAEGCQTLTQYIKVGQPYATLDIELEPLEDSVSGNGLPGESVSGNGVSGNSVSGNGISGNSAGDGASVVNASGDYRVYITAPEGAEVYYDGRYMGQVPLDMKKEEGVHVVTLRQSGRQTRSFTMQVDGEAKDVSWAFSELEKLDTGLGLPGMEAGDLSWMLSGLEALE